jgi:RHS repeat-associated protein
VEQQTTRFLYADPVNGSLQTGKVYPDSTNVLARDTNQAWAVVSGVDHMTYSYDWMGRLTGSTDQRGVVRVFLYDAAGRLVADVVTVLPDGVDGTVRRIGRTYTDAGAAEKVTACSDPTGSVVTNEIAYRYDGWGNVTNVQQAHQGAVDVSAPTVRYEHEDGAVSGEARYVRLARLVYPSGQEVRYVYPTNGVGAKLARLAALTDTNGLAYVQYAYLGVSTLSGKAFLMVTNTLVLSYGQDGSYSGWDTFGRVVDQKWTVGTQVVDRFQYVYDRGGRRIAKTVLPLLAADLDETYAYDNLNQLIRMDRSNGVNQVWDLEPAGNWAVFATNDVAQTREHNAANEMVAIDAATNALAHDAAGNMVRFPLPLGEGQGEGVLCTWDAWNQLMSVSTDGVQIATFAYDGTQRRIRKETPAGASDFFYDGWNMVEERLAGGAAQVTNGYVWGLDLSGTMQGAGGIGGLVARCSLAGDSPAFYCADANGNVTALFADDGTNVARYVYDPYGTVVNRSGALADENVYRFSTKYADDETGLVYYGYRYYSPGLGRWLSRDPLLEEGQYGVRSRHAPNGRRVKRRVDNFGYGRHTGRYDGERNRSDAAFRKRAGTPGEHAVAWHHHAYVAMNNSPTCVIDLLGLANCTATEEQKRNAIIALCQTAYALAEQSDTDAEQRVEFCGIVCCKGTVIQGMVGDPHRGTRDYCNPRAQPATRTALPRCTKCQEGWDEIAHYHSNPTNPDVSPGDKAWAQGNGVPLYMCHRDICKRAETDGTTVTPLLPAASVP